MTYAQTGGSGLPDYSYAFDAGSNITRKTFEHRDSDPSEDYSHDGLDRLTKTTFGQRSATPYEGFTYDDLGNHLTQDHDGTTVAGLFNAVNEQTKRDGNDLIWDLRGNLTEDDDGKEYFYDRNNLLTRVEDGSSNRAASYAYDALGRRIEKDVEDAGGDIVTRFYYSGHRMVEETDDGGTPSVEREYVWGATYIDELLLYSNGSDDYFAAGHHNFNVVALLDATDGSVVERYDYNPYGQRFVLDGDYSDDADGLSDVGLAIGHQGLLHDVESGLIYNRARMHNPRLRRWMQREPLGYLDGMSLYQYVRGNPLVYFDPTGRQAQDQGEVLSTEGQISWLPWKDNWEDSLALQDTVDAFTPDVFPQKNKDTWEREYRENFARMMKGIYAMYQDLFATKENEDWCCKLDPCTLAAQWMHESTWGSSRLARETFNFGGIKGEGPAGSYNINTGEHLQGQDVVVNANFRAYNNILEYMDDYTRLICTKDRYEEARGKSGREYYEAIKNAGYATDPNYVEKNMAMYNQLGCGK
ncbi:MAG: hypothetical protein GVY30_01065 [Chloroflexi bacterium]|jgi:RHS repeat-associated protein|nr:hypothetical protein [Chloroflexota bacterium]